MTTVLNPAAPGYGGPTGDQGLLNPSPSGFIVGGHRRMPLTRDEMVAVIKRGESILWNGFIIWQEQHLPSEAQLSVGDKDKEKVAAQRMQAQIDKMQADLQALLNGTLQPPVQQNDIGPRIGSPANPVVQSSPDVIPKTKPTGTLDAATQEEIRAAQRAALLRTAPDMGISSPAPAVTTSAPPDTQ